MVILILYYYYIIAILLLYITILLLLFISLDCKKVSTLRPSVGPWPWAAVWSAWASVEERCLAKKGQCRYSTVQYSTVQYSFVRYP